MFATPAADNTKASVLGKPRQDDFVPSGRKAQAPNPHWQSLALGPRSVQPKLAVSQPGDPQELEADHIADRVMRMATPESGITHSGQSLSRKEESGSVNSPAAAPPIVNKALSSPGQPLDPGTRAFMEPRFNHDFSQVRVHTDPAAGESARAVSALAFTSGRDVVFGPGHYQPQSEGGRRLLAHELAHVVQQSTSQTPGIQRTIEVRPTGRGENSAFARRDELIDRMNRVSPATRFRLDGRVIMFDPVPGVAVTHFEQTVRDFIGRGAVVPLRLITSAGRLGGGPVLIDAYELGYVDLDDLLASDDLSFQLNLIHILAERFRVQNYARRIGTPGMQAVDRGTGRPTPEFLRAHGTGTEAEAELLRRVIGDPTLRFNGEEERANGTLVFDFRSNEGYAIFHVFRGAGHERQHGEIFVRTRDGRRLTIDQLIAERAAAARPPAAAPAAPAPAPAPPGP